MKIDLCHVYLIKQKEDFLFVWYKFELSCLDEDRLDIKGKLNWKPHFGVIKISKNIFNKDLNEPEEQSVEIEKEGTDPIFFKINAKQFEDICSVCIKAIYLQKEGDSFPEKPYRVIG